MTNSDDVLAFHNKFCVPMATEPSLLDWEAYKFRRNFLHEELSEFEDSAARDDLEGMADALIDLVYIAMGTAHMMGLPWQPLWNRVQEANMTKRLAKPDGSDSKRGSPLDVVKPPGWVGPDHSTLLPRPYPTFDATAAIAALALERRNEG
jgi:predicted HAD superfamily Cof-like phosphohydrolase